MKSLSGENRHEEEEKDYDPSCGGHDVDRSLHGHVTIFVVGVVRADVVAVLRLDVGRARRAAAVVLVLSLVLVGVRACGSLSAHRAVPRRLDLGTRSGGASLADGHVGCGAHGVKRPTRRSLVNDLDGAPLADEALVVRVLRRLVLQVGREVDLGLGFKFGSDSATVRDRSPGFAVVVARVVEGRSRLNLVAASGRDDVDEDPLISRAEVRPCPASA